MDNISFHLKIGETKPFLSIDDQLDLLIKRGLIVSDRNNALNILNRTNYYRFSAYSLTLRKDNVFYPNITFDNIYEIFADSVLLLIARHYSLLFWVWLCKMYFIKKITFFFNNRKQILA